MNDEYRVNACIPCMPGNPGNPAGPGGPGGPITPRIEQDGKNVNQIIFWSKLGKEIAK